MKGTAIFAKMFVSVLIILIILTVLITFAGAGFYIAVFISISGFIMFGISGLIFWFTINYYLNKIIKYHSACIFISAMIASLLSGFTFEFIRADFLIYEVKDVLATQFLTMPIAILSALIYLLIFSRKTPST